MDFDRAKEKEALPVLLQETGLTPVIIAELRQMLERVIEALVVQEVSASAARVLVPAEEEQLIFSSLAGLTKAMRVKLLYVLRGTIVQGALFSVFWDLENREIVRGTRSLFQTHSREEIIFSSFGEARRLLRRDDLAALQPFFAAIDICRARCPRGADGRLLSPEELAIVSREETDACAFQIELTIALENAMHTLLQTLQEVPFIPRDPTGSQGEGSSLTPGDIEDVRTFLHWNILIARAIEMEVDVFFRRANAVAEGAMQMAIGTVIFSVFEGAFFSFLKRRFPRLFLDIDAEIPREWYGAKHLSVELKSQIVAARQRKHALWRNLYEQLLREKNDCARRMPYLSAALQTEAELTIKLAHEILPKLCKHVGYLGDFYMLSNILTPPKSTKRTPADPTLAARPLPHFLLIKSIEEDTGKWYRHQINSTMHRPRITREVCTAITLKMGISIGRMNVHLNGAVAVHRPGGPPCPPDQSLYPLMSLMHPEEPAALFLNHCGREYDNSFAEVRDICCDLGIERILSMGKEIPHPIFVWRTRKHPKRLFGLLRARKSSTLYLVLSRQEAVTLDVEQDVLPLPRVERDFLIERGVQLPENPVMLVHSDDEGNEGNEAQSPPPSGEPTVLPEPRPRPRETVPV